ncbi:uncharacterized protein SPSC_00072 [Sporisorium scitamineum]|uniref:Uncharacterized protein n=1 Tax=Sporisorium scitamineum TaxID=49012 RepID=A0A127Z5E7_9BASI|nr:uncharacterized protein SPSC_00072 [Sporisorium scitamineum]
MNRLTVQVTGVALTYEITVLNAHYELRQACVQHIYRTVSRPPFPHRIAIDASHDTRSCSQSSIPSHCKLELSEMRTYTRSLFILSVAMLCMLRLTQATRSNSNRVVAITFSSTNSTIFSHSHTTLPNDTIASTRRRNRDTIPPTAARNVPPCCCARCTGASRTPHLGRARSSNSLQRQRKTLHSAWLGCFRPSRSSSCFRSQQHVSRRGSEVLCTAPPGI